MVLEVTDDYKFLKVVEADQIEIDQLKLSLNKKIEGWFFHPLVKKNFGMVI